MRFLFLLLFTSLATACNAAPLEKSDQHLAKSAAAEATAALENLVDKGFKGSVLVACNGDVVFNKSFGLTLPADEVVRYYVASVTKGITAIAVMKLIEEDALEIDEPISTFFPDAPADKQDITIYDLLTHGSGLQQNYAADGIADRNAAAAAILAQPLSDPPGARFGYTNDGYSLLAIIIEMVTGGPYEDHIAETVMEPLGLSAIAFWPEALRDGEYIPPLLNPYEPETESLDWGFRGGHGARLSVDELYAITEGVETETLLSQSSREAMQKAHFTSRSGLGVGMGWFLETDDAGRNLRWMRGTDQNGGNGLSYVVDGAGVTIVAMSNAGPDRPELRAWSVAAKDALLPIYAPVENGLVQARCN